MLTEYLEKQAAGVQTAADQFRQIASMLDKTGAAPELKYFSVKNPESNIYALERYAPGGVTELLTQADKPRVAKTTNNPHVEQFTPEPPTDGRAGRQSAQSDSPVGTVDPLKDDSAGDSKLKTASASVEATKKAPTLFETLMSAYRAGRNSASLKRLGKELKRDTGSDEGIETYKKLKGKIKELPGKFRAAAHVGEHRNKYLVGGSVAATGGTAAVLGRDKPKKKTAGLLSGYKVGRSIAKKQKGKVIQTLQGGKTTTHNLDFSKKEDVAKLKELIPAIWNRKLDRTGLHLGQHRDKYIAGAATGAVAGGAAVLGRDEPKKDIKKAAGFWDAYKMGRTISKSKTLSNASEALRGHDSGITGGIEEARKRFSKNTVENVGRHLGEHRDKYLLGGAALGGTAILASPSAKTGTRDRNRVHTAAAKLIDEGRIRKEAFNVKPMAGALQESAKQARKVGVPKAIKSPQMGPIRGFLKGK